MQPFWAQFKYLLKNDVTFYSTLLEFAVHGRNPEIIHLVEDSLNDGSKIKPKRNSFGFNFSHQNQLKSPIGALKESIKCYHNEIADYIEQNGCGENDEEELQNEIIKFGFSFYNYEFIPDDFNILMPISKYQPKYYHYEQNDDAFQVFYLLTKITIPSSVNTETKDYNDDEEENNSERSQFYFYPELDQINYQFKNDSKLPENYQIDNEKRRIGENDSEICKIIRNDSVEEFILYNSKFDQNIKNYQSNPGSSYETNQLLYQVKFIQYAAFFGAIKIFNFLYNKTFDVDSDTCNNNGRFLMEKDALWYFAIHGRQQEIIHILDIKGIKPTKRQNPDE